MNSTITVDWWKILKTVAKVAAWGIPTYFLFHLSTDIHYILEIINYTVVGVQ